MEIKILPGQHIQGRRCRWGNWWSRNDDLLIIRWQKPLPHEIGRRSCSEGSRNQRKSTCIARTCAGNDVGDAVFWQDPCYIPLHFSIISYIFLMNDLISSYNFSVRVNTIDIYSTENMRASFERALQWQQHLRYLQCKIFECWDPVILGKDNHFKCEIHKHPRQLLLLIFFCYPFFFSFFLFYWRAVRQNFLQYT